MSPKSSRALLGIKHTLTLLAIDAEMREFGPFGLNQIFSIMKALCLAFDIPAGWPIVERLSVDREGKKVELIVVRPMEVRWAGFAITFLIGATIGSFGEFGLPRLRPLHAEDVRQTNMQ